MFLSRSLDRCETPDESDDLDGDALEVFGEILADFDCASGHVVVFARGCAEMVVRKRLRCSGDHGVDGLLAAVTQ